MGNGETSPTQYKVTASHAPDCGIHGSNANDTKAKQIGQHVPALPSQQRLSHHAAGNQRTADAERCATQRECMPMPNAAFTMSDAEMRHRLSNCVDIL